MTDLFIFDVLSHASVRLLSVLIIVLIFEKCFGKQWKHNTNKALISCATVLILDFVVIDSVRFVISSGISTALFFPVAMPICFMIIMIFSLGDKSEKTTTFLVGIPLLLLSVFIEIYSFFKI